MMGESGVGGWAGGSVSAQGQCPRYQSIFANGIREILNALNDIVG